MSCVFQIDIVRRVLPVQPATRQASEASSHSNTTTEEPFVDARQQRKQWGGCEVITTNVGGYAPPQICRIRIFSQQTVVLIFSYYRESERFNRKALVVKDHCTLTTTPSQQHDRGGMLTTKLYNYYSYKMSLFSFCRVPHSQWQGFS